MKQIHKTKRKYRLNEISLIWNAFWTISMTFLGIVFILPLVLVVVVSLSSGKSLTLIGYKFIPLEWSMVAYETIVKASTSFGQSYKMTIFYSFGGTALSLVVMSMLAYVLARKDFKYRRVLSLFVFFTTLFSGGLVPSYILNVKYLHLKDTIWIFLLPSLVSSFDVIILRTFVQTTVPESLFDAAKIDGANDFSVYYNVVLPLFKAGLATVGLFNVVSRWNDWFTGVMYIEDPKLTPIMTLLQRIQNSIELLKANSTLASSPDGIALLNSMPSESTRMALAVLAILPLLVMYPFFQKYFVKGLTIGSVKG